MRKMKESKELMKNLAFKIHKKGIAKIFKLNKIKSEFQSKLESLSQNTKFELDFNAYKSVEQARKVLFSSVFSFSKSKTTSSSSSSSAISIKTKVIFLFYNVKILVGYQFKKYKRKKKSIRSNRKSIR